MLGNMHFLVDAAGPVSVTGQSQSLCPLLQSSKVV